MLSRYRYLVALLMVVGIAATLVLAWRHFAAGSIKRVTTVAAALGTVEGRLNANGTATIRSCHSEWVFGIPGARVLAAPALGSRVRAGEILMTLFDASIDGTLGKARETLAAARDQAGLACTAGPPARRAPRRLESRLRERVADAARRGEFRHQPAVDAPGEDSCAIARRALAQASRVEREVERRRQALMVLAPIDGIVSEVTVAADSIVADQPLLRLASERCLLARVRFRPDAARWIVPGGPACVQAPGGSVPPVCTARLGKPIPSPEDVLVDVQLDALPAGIRIGTPIVVSLPLSSGGDVVRVDRKAVYGPDGNPHVWWIDAASGRVHRRAVQTGVRGDRYIEIRQGLVPGDQLAIGSGAALSEGTRVQTVVDPSGR